MGRTKKSCVVIVMCLACFFITACDTGVQVNGSKELFDAWLEYRNHVENTEVLAEAEPTGNEAGQSEAETGQPETETGQPGTEAGKPETEAEQVAEKHGFYYSYLSDSMKVVYNEIYESLLTRKEKDLSSLTEEHVDLAFQCVLYDHPEIFYVTGYHLTKRTMDDAIVGISISGEYVKTPEEAVELQKKIDTYVNTCIAGMPQGLDEYGKVKYIFDYLVTNTKYNLNAADNQNICSVFVNGESVCQGYAEAAQYLLQKIGMEATVVAGNVESGGRHAWNLVKVDDAYYYMDPTWGDVDYRDSGAAAADSAEKTEPINYDYFLVTTAQLEKTHVIETPLPMPACVSTENNYYIREGLYFESVDEARLAAVFADAHAANRQYVTIKCSDENIFAMMKQFLLEEQGIFRYVDTVNAISYSEDERMCTLCFWM